MTLTKNKHGVRWGRLLPALTLMILLGYRGAVLAQGDPNEITVTVLNDNALVEDIITEATIFDWWQTTAIGGDILTIQMTASDGLEPLIGILDPNRNLAITSDRGAVNGSITLTYTVEETGEYTIVATRADNANGTSTGTYTLLLTREHPQPVTVDLYREVMFACVENLQAPNLLTVEFGDDAGQTESILISVYGLDGLSVGLRTTLQFDFEPFNDQFCLPPTTPPTFESRLTFPNSAPLEITTANAARVMINTPERYGVMQFNVAALNDVDGRYVMVIDGLQIGRNGDRDRLDLGVGGLALGTVLDVYMVSDKTSRLDPAIEQVDPDSLDLLRLCDDAGNRLCPEVPPLTGFELLYGNEKTLSGGRFDAGIQLEPTAAEMLSLLLGGYQRRTYGNYALVIVGQLPALSAP
ncbi:MAG: hypothetical protein ACOYL5_05600 [Phototrophicaceae bacterium]